MTATKSGRSTFKFLTHSLANQCWPLFWSSGWTGGWELCYLSTGTSPQAARAFLEHRGWVPRAGVPRQLGRSAWCFDVLASEVMQFHFHCTLYLRQSQSFTQTQKGETHSHHSTGGMWRSQWKKNMQDGRSCSHHLGKILTAIVGQASSQ